MSAGAQETADLDSLVDDVVARAGRRIVLGLPLGLGKPNRIANALYARAQADPALELTILTALTLERPRPSNELERRLVEPLTERLFGDWPELSYARDRSRGRLPPNVDVVEFFFLPGSKLHDPLAQRHHLATNYTHVLRDALARGMNVFAQLVGRAETAAGTRYSLSSNSDIGVDLLRLLAREPERKILVLGEVDRRLPFFGGDAQLGPEVFHALLDAPQGTFTLPSVPSLPISDVEYAIAAHASALVRDGGTLQIGIGALGDAIARMLTLRHTRNGSYRAVLADLGTLTRNGATAEALGGLAPFARGLYAATEMLVPGLVELRRAGVLRREVHEHAGLQRLLDDGRLESLAPGAVDVLVEAGVLDPALSADACARLRRAGVLRADVAWAPGVLLRGAERFPLDELAAPEDRVRFARACLGTALADGAVCHAGFFLGPRAFYEELRAMSDRERARFRMAAISFVNELYGDEELKTAQRRHARFLNTAIAVTLLGGVGSDTLPDGRVVGGVGGQYNFVAMAHELPEARAVTLLRSTRTTGRSVTSQIVRSFPNLTIPRHLRDVVVTEYGIADLRGRTDEECIRALVGIADARFQDELVRHAREDGKLAPDWRVPEHARANTPAALTTRLARHRAELPPLPFGTDFTPEELLLRRALQRLQADLSGGKLPRVHLGSLAAALRRDDARLPYLRRMGLDTPKGLHERWLALLVRYGLARTAVPRPEQGASA